MSNIRFNRTDLWGVTERLFKAGLHLALVCPFSVTVNEIIVRKGGLNRYYNRSYGWACDLARDLQENLPVARNRVHVFMPAQGTLVYTPIRLDEMRPALTKFSEVPGDSGKDRVPARYELGSYVKFGDGKPDRWVEIYNGEGEPAERVAEDYFAWFDFFSDIFNNWTPTPDGSQYDTSKLGFWQLADRT